MGKNYLGSRLMFFWLKFSNYLKNLHFKWIKLRCELTQNWRRINKAGRIKWINYTNEKKGSTSKRLRVNETNKRNWNSAIIIIDSKRLREWIWNNQL